MSELSDVRLIKLFAFKASVASRHVRSYVVKIS